jgi:hypothetical protein
MCLTDDFACEVIFEERTPHQVALLCWRRRVPWVGRACLAAQLGGVAAYETGPATQLPFIRSEDALPRLVELFEVEAGAAALSFVLEAAGAHGGTRHVCFGGEVAGVLAQDGSARLFVLGSRSECGATFVTRGAVANQIGGGHRDPIPPFATLASVIGFALWNHGALRRAMTLRRKKYQCTVGTWAAAVAR